MIEVSPITVSRGSVAVLAASVFTLGCNKKPKTVSAPPSAPPAPLLLSRLSRYKRTPPD